MSATDVWDTPENKFLELAVDIKNFLLLGTQAFPKRLWIQ